MNEITDEERAARARARIFLRASLKGFGEIALIHQREPEITGAASYGRMMAPLYREFRIRHKFFECV
jgi:hypothetical protein